MLIYVNDFKNKGHQKFFGGKWKVLGYPLKIAAMTSLVYNVL